MKILKIVRYSLTIISILFITSLVLKIPVNIRANSTPSLLNDWSIIQKSDSHWQNPWLEVSNSTLVTNDSSWYSPTKFVNQSSSNLNYVNTASKIKIENTDSTSVGAEQSSRLSFNLEEDSLEPSNFQLVVQDCLYSDNNLEQVCTEIYSEILSDAKNPVLWQVLQKDSCIWLAWSDSFGNSLSVLSIYKFEYNFKEHKLIKYVNSFEYNAVKSISSVFLSQLSNSDYLLNLVEGGDVWLYRISEDQESLTYQIITLPLYVIENKGKNYWQKSILEVSQDSLVLHLLSNEQQGMRFRTKKVF